MREVDRFTMLAEGKVTEADLKLIAVTDSPAEARDLTLASAQKKGWSAEREEEVREVTREALGQHRTSSRRPERPDA